MEKRMALLVIDMQKGSFTAKTPRFDTKGVVNRINRLADRFREAKSPVFFIQHNGDGTGEFEKNTWEWELLDQLTLEPVDIRLDKYANDVFYRSSLQAQLTKMNIQELVVMGCATDFCVASTVQSALTKDYEVTVVSDGHTTAERPHLSAEKVIEHYNWVWQHMIPTQGKIKVESYDHIMKMFTGKIYN
ncbi:MAG: cysteine hydrolase family protein [Bacteroidota bacterium]